MGVVDREECPLCGGRAASPLLAKEGALYVKCPDCSLVYTTPAPDEDTLRRVAEEWAVSHHASHDRMEWEKQAVLSTILFGKRMKIINRYKKLGSILDVGCSTGNFLEYAAGVGWRVSGSELAGHTARLAAERLPRADIRSGPFMAAGFEAASFDVVTMWDVIEHLVDPGEALSGAFRLLRQGGLLVIATPNYNSLSRRLLGAKWEGLIPPRHLTVFTSRALSDMVAARGGKVVVLRAIDVNPLDLMAAFKRKGEYGFQKRQRNISRVKSLFARWPMMAYGRDALNWVLSLSGLGDVIEICAERVR